MNSRSCKELSDAFIEFCKKNNLSITQGNEYTSSQILGYWSDLGVKEGFNIWVQNRYSKGTTREYLVDLCWCFEYDNILDYWVELALESEISSKSIEGIEYDFYKLIDIKSFTKVGIFSPKKRDVEEYLKNLSEIIAYSGIKIPYENYLIIFLIDQGVREHLRLEIKTYHLNYQGEITPLHQVQLPDV